MRRLYLAGVLLLAGCQHIVGPLQRTPQQVDDPLLTIGEQQRRGRERLALPVESGNVAPSSGAQFRGSTGR